MSHRPYRLWLWAVALAPLCVGTAAASSITTYGSIVLSTLGTEGMSTVTTDGAVGVASASTDAGMSGGTSDAGMTKSLSPLMNRPGSRGGNGGGGGGGGGGGRNSTPPTASQGVPDSTIADPNPPSSDTSSTGADPLPPSDSPPREEVPQPPIDTSLPDDIVTVGPPQSTGIDTIPDVPTEGPLSPDTSSSSNADPVEESPEPATLTLLGLAGLGAYLKARRRK